jgi:endonuclease YncB( thermonuclease family)
MHKFFVWVIRQQYPRHRRDTDDRAFDGDRLAFYDNQGRPFRVRLSGIDAEGATQHFDKEARDYLAYLIEGKWVAVVWSKQHVSMWRRSVGEKQYVPCHGAAWTRRS